MREPERTVFELHAMHELAYPVVAERLGISVEEVEQRLVAALLLLQSALPDDVLVAGSIILTLPKPPLSPRSWSFDA